MRSRRLARTMGLAAVIVPVFFEPAFGQGALSCSADFQVVHSFSNGAAWEMCWERRNREGIVLYDIHYTNDEGNRRKVLHQAGVAQIHVPYDDDGARFHDVSDYGLGTNNYLNDLQPVDCPTGTLISDSSKNVLCMTTLGGIDSSITGTSVDRGEAIGLFSVSHVGAYNYIPEWTFFDDGAIEVAMGATGKLQRFGSDPQYGWPVNNSANPIGVSHLHNYFWRLDFDIGGDGANDVVEEIEFIAEDGTGRTRAKSVAEFDTETARSVSPATMRFWRVKDTAILNSEGAAISYEILPLETGHRDVGPNFEPFTFQDLYVTTYRPCEKFASHNPADGPGGCAANEDVSDFVDGESLLEGDVVVWFGLTFHHIPRDEDENFMPSHWNRFRMTPRDWIAGSVPVPNSPPALDNPGDQAGNVSDSVSLQLVASDAEGQSLSYSAIGLPPSLAVSAVTGEISGDLTVEGTYPVTVVVTDSEGASDSAQFSWDVGPRPNASPDLQNPGPQENEAGDIVSLQIVASDADGDVLTYAADALPPGLTADTYTGLISGQLTTTGNTLVNISVSDGFGGVATESFTWNVGAPTANIAPIVTNPGDQGSNVGDDVILDIIAIDVNTDTLAYSAEGLPDGLSIDPATGRISGSPATGDTYSVIVTVNDGNGGVTETSFSWIVSAGILIDVGPVGMGLTGFDSATGTGYAMYTAERIQTRFVSPPIDPNSADHVAIVRYSSGNWQYVTDTAFVNFIPRPDDLLIATVDFTADAVAHLVGNDVLINGIRAGYIDSDVVITPNMWNGSSNAGEFGISGTFILANGGMPPQPNLPPVLEPVGNQFNTVDDTVSLQLQATDQDDDPLTYSESGLPAGLSLNPSTGLISGQPTAIGVYDLTLSVDDGNGGSDSEQISWSVSASGGTAIDIGSVGLGITGYDSATGAGYAMYTEERMQTRFTSPPIDPASADHILAVRYFSGNWQYITDNEFVNFVPRATDLLIAELDFSADTVNMLSGTDSVVNGIRSGYASSDVVVTPNMWNGRTNAGEFGLSGTTLITN